MPQFDEQIARLVEHDGAVVYVAVAAFVAALVLWAVGRAAREPRMPVEQRRKVKEEIVRLMRGEYRGLTAAGIGKRLGIELRELRPLLAGLIEDRFLTTEGDADDPIYRLKGVDNY